VGRHKQRGFGRIAPPNRDKDEMYLMRRALAAAGTALPTRKTWPINRLSLDQGQTGTCVGHAWRNFLRCAPLRTEKSGPSPFDIYRSAVTNSWGDEWGKSGEFYLPFRDLERLIADNGEACTAVEKSLSAKAAAPPRTSSQLAAAA